MSTTNFKFYGSKQPIFWSKDSEDRPSESYFNSIDFQWELFSEYTPNYLDKWTANITLPFDSYTYFKLENTLTNSITYWFVDKTQKILNSAVVYQISMDIYASYILNIMKQIPPEAKVGIERTHIGFNDYKKYLFPFIEDELVGQGACGYGPTKIDSCVEISRVVSSGYSNIYLQFKNLKPDNISHRFRFIDNDSAVALNNIVRCYVFYDLQDTSITDREAHFSRKRYYIFPVIEQEENREMYMESNEGRPDTNKILGNTVSNMAYLVKQVYATNKFVGIFPIPFYFNEPIKWISINQGNGSPVDYYYYGYSFEFDGKQVDTSINTFLISRNPQDYKESLYPVVFPTNKVIYNNPETEWNITATSKHHVNVYSFLQLNKQLYNRNVSPILWFNFVNNNLSLDLKGRIVFSQGFKIFSNINEDILDLGGELPSDKESYAAYVNGIKETMNTAIKVSRDNMILSTVKNYFKFMLSSGQLGAGVVDLLAGEGTGGIFKGVNGMLDSTFNIAGSAVNHVNTIKMYEAQLTDAKNSITPAINNSSDSDLSILMNSKIFTGNIVNLNVNQAFLLQRLSKSMCNMNDNMVFLFGVAIKNYLPWKLITANATKDNMPCYYISFMNSYASVQFFNFIRNTYPTMDLETIRIIVEAMVLGYRIWKQKPNLFQSYQMIID